MPGVYRNAMRGILFALSALIWLSLVPGGARADMYTIAGLAVDETAETVAEAREKAQAAALKTGFQQLLQQITPQDRWPELPTLPEGQEQEFVDALNIEGEKGTTERYIATLAYSYNPARVQQLLLDAGIPFTQSAAQPVLVLPLMRVNNQASLWQEGSPWLEAWASHETEFGLVPLTVPFGDVDDVAAISANEALSADPGALQRMADRYGVANIAVADGALTGQEGGRMQLDITISFIAGRAAAPVSRSFVMENAGNALDLMTQAAGAMLNQMRDEWKSATLLETADESVVAALVKIRDLAEWRAIQQQLQAVPTIRRVDIVSMSVEEVLVNLTFLGSADQLQRAVERTALGMENDNGFWTLRAGRG